MTAPGAPVPSRPARRQRSGREVSAWATALVAASGSVMLTATSASASVSPVSGDAAGARALAAAMSSQTGLVTGASWNAFPPDGVRTDAVSTAPLTSFPVADRSYAMLTTGDAATAGAFQRRGGFGTLVNGGGARGDDAFDISVLKVDVVVPAGDNCLGFDFRFLSDEFPEHVGSGHDDAFVAELDSTTWTTRGSEIEAPGNFAADPGGHAIGAGATGVTAMSAREGAGTAYDGATPHLNARTAVSAGAHSVYLSIFDQGDRVNDSAVLLDNLHTFVDRSCDSGAEQTNESDSQTVAAGGSVTTDGRGDGATETDPIETTAVGRDTGLLRIEESTNLQKSTAPPGFSMLDVQATVASLAVPDAWVAVTAPAGLMGVSSRTAGSAGAGRPTTVRMVVDATALPEAFSPDGLVLLRNGVAVRRCVGSATGSAPCQAASLARDGDLVVQVSTTSPSTFTFAVPNGSVATVTCDGMPATIVATHGAIKGTPGDDVIVGTHGHDTIEAGDGDDIVCAGDGNDTVLGGPGDDLIETDAGHDHAQGGPGDDQVAGNDGSDRLLGDDGHDLVLGGEGHDKLLGGAGVDRCDGGPGTDHPTDCESITGVP